MQTPPRGNGFGSPPLVRRQFGKWALAAGMAGVASRFELARGNTNALQASRKFTMDLCPGRLGVSVGQAEAIELAARFRFESVEPFGAFLAEQSVAELQEWTSKLSEKKLTWGAAGLSVEFRQDQETFETGLKALPKIAAALQTAGVTRVGTWLMPAHDELTYLKNFKQHTERLRAVASVLDAHGLRLGLEYVGPRTLWASKRYPFLHTLAETAELIAAINTGNVGLVLDSWHWYTAEETVTELESLSAEQIVAVDLNDAPAGIDVRDQIDNRRELPSATGVIDLAEFLNALVKIGYDGPVRAEPFNQSLNAMDDAPAVEATAKAMRTSFALLSRV